MAHASESLTAFAGKALEAVLGLSSSNLRSTIRLNPMAQVRAPTIANTIQQNVAPSGTPRVDRKAPMKANGRAKTVCSNLIISSNMVIFLNIDLLSFRQTSKDPSSVSGLQSQFPADLPVARQQNLPFLQDFPVDDKKKASGDTQWHLHRALSTYFPGEYD